ncbi:SAM-dependent methyltransferase, partial [candidate division KSB3 bacterium]|nr:SAM-dependent methyltransferase [candidate division KSB3 bacterium]
MRIFSMTQWYHFAYMIISIALLGFGVSGTVISVVRTRLTRRFSFYYRLFAGLFTLSILGSYLLSQRNRFNPFEIVWDPRQYLFLVEYYLVLFVPFFLAALCLGLAFTRYTERIGLLYGVNLVGSGVGAIGIIVCFYFFHPVEVLYIILGIGCWGTAAAFLRRKKRAGMVVAVMLGVGVVVVFALRSDPLGLREHLRISEYKGLSAAKKFPDAQMLTESVSPLGVVQTVSSPVIRYAPGISLNYTGEIPSQIGLFVDAGNAGVIVDAANAEYLDFLSSSLVYHVRPISRALILGAGGGTDVLNALAHGVASVEAVEVNPDVLRLVRERFADVTGHLYARPDVRVFAQEARGFIEMTSATYETIQLSLLDSFGASAAGVHALHENYLYTLEALTRYYERLASGGILSITRWVRFPPRDTIKLFATAVEALERVGIADASQHLVCIRSWATSTVLVSASPFTSEELARVQQFCHDRSFDLAYFPGITREDANRYTQLPSAEYYVAAQAILFGDREAFYRDYPYYIRPARDGSPYFFHFFKWKSLMTLLRTMGKEWIPFMEWGFLVLLATLLQAGILSILLILVPLLFLPRRATRLRDRGATVVYFTCLGLGYLFIEVVYIQKFTLFLANPVFS